MVEAWAYNDQVPGPQIRVHVGRPRVASSCTTSCPSRRRFTFTDSSCRTTMDGVPFITQPPVKPGQSFTYEFTVPNAGSHMYHSHHNSAKQVGLGLLGAFIVEPKEKTQYDTPDVDEVSSSTTARTATRSTARAFRRRSRSSPSWARRCASAS